MTPVVGQRVRITHTFTNDGPMVRGEAVYEGTVSAVNDTSVTLDGHPYSPIATVSEGPRVVEIEALGYAEGTVAYVDLEDEKDILVGYDGYFWRGIASYGTYNPDDADRFTNIRVVHNGQVPK